jgi:hypothetical protein
LNVVPEAHARATGSSLVAHKVDRRHHRQRMDEYC